MLLVLVAGCSAPLAGGDGAGGTDGGQTPGETTAPETSRPGPWTWPEDPPSDRLGWETGYWYNESIAVDQSDGLNESERRAFVGRTMARVEVIRELEFTREVPVEVVSRTEYRNRSGVEPDPAAAAWNDVVWEALFLVGEDREASDVFDELYGGAVQGFYGDEDRIVIVSDADTPGIERNTLAHELVHALQDQRFGLPPVPPGQDPQLARDGLVEGDARLVEALYQRRCGEEWECVAGPRGGSSGGGGFDFGVYLVIYTPYSEGPTFVHSLREAGGWEAVDAAYDRVPTSTEQILHPERYPEESPAAVSVPDRSSAAWSRFDHDPAGDTVGEASLFVTLQRNNAIDPNRLRENTGEFSPYNYVARATDGWAGDQVVPYRRADGATGYVFRSEWDTVEDAEQFERTFTSTLLRLRLGARDLGNDTYVVESGPYADAFRVTREGSTITVVNAPTVSALDEVHARE